MKSERLITQLELAPPLQESWINIKELVDKALDLEGERRSEFLDAACSGNADLRREVEELLDPRLPNLDLDSPVASDIPELVDQIFDEDLVGQSVGNYQLLKQIGYGGMGVVYLAERSDGSFNKKVAIKLLSLGRSSEANSKRFEIERRILAALVHPNISRLLDGGETEDGRSFLVMEYVDGKPIVEYANENRLSIVKRLELFLKVCDTIQFAHQNLIVHRDIKPKNILVTKEGEPILLDFGIAKVLEDSELMNEAEPALTRTNQRMMTPHYASPEQIKGRPITIGSDVYSLGVLLYKLLTSKSPYPQDYESIGDLEDYVCRHVPRKPSSRLKRSTTEMDINMAVLEDSFSEPLPKVSKFLSGDLDSIIQKALRKNVSDRFLTVENFAADINRFLRTEPVLAREGQNLYKISRFVYRNRVGVFGTSLISIVAAAVLIFSGLRINESEKKALKENEYAQQTTNYLIGLFDLADPTSTNPTLIDSISVREILKNGVRNDKINLLEDHISKTRILESLARLHFNLGQYQQADSLVDMGLKLIKADEEPLPANLGPKLGLMKAEILLQMGQGNSAQQLLTELLREISTKSVNSELKTDIEASLADALAVQGRFKQAYELQSKVFQKSMNQVGLSDEKLADRYSHYASSLSDIGSYETALTHYEKALSMYKSLYGNKHPYVSTTLNNLGNASLNLGLTEKAQRYLFESLEIDLNILGKNHFLLNPLYTQIGTTFEMQANYDEATEYYSKAKEISLKTFPNGDQTLIVAEHDLARLQRKRGLYAAAIEKCNEVLLRASQIKDKEISPISLARINITKSQSLYEQNNHAMAISVAENAMKILVDSDLADDTNFIMARSIKNLSLRNSIVLDKSLSGQLVRDLGILKRRWGISSNQVHWLEQRIK